MAEQGRPDNLDRFVDALIASLAQRYDCCTPIATPDSILLAVLNAVYDARGAVERETSGDS